MVRGGRKGRARPARDTGRPETPVVAPDDTPDSPSTEQGEKSNETVDASNVEAANKQQQDSSLPTPEAAAMKSPVKGAYAAMADPEEGTTLNFVTSPMVNGMKCAKIETKGVQSKLDFWQSAVLCSVIGANPPLEVLEGIWKAYEIDRISWVRKGVFLIRFHNMTDQAAVVQRGVYFFDNKSFIVKPWREDLNLNIENLATLPVWVRFPYLEVKYWGPDSLSKLGSLLGIPIKIDKFPRDKTILKYARLLIEMKLQDSFPEYIDFVNEHDMVVRQKVEYEWKPSKCNFCRMYGHSDAECRKKPIPRTE
ncbi:hypothetical protein Cgig2_031915 [Carnegiea gigantea]|uniref:DUF4283 domain-containing protein n=1 Tax=Carnegiea gigantea TaxID=171969 RepID=A0A9Q1GIU5_9CARY|nr:hypothetical protein Cgig2_031915 [Carnegiea gigantea]